MDIKEFIKKMASQIVVEEDRELFLEAINELNESGEELTVEDVLTLFEGIGNSDNEVDSSSASKAEKEMNKADGALVSPDHKKRNSEPKEKQDTSKVSGMKGLPEDKEAGEKMSDYAKKLNDMAKQHVKDSKAVKEGVEVGEEISKIFEGADFTDDFKEKATTILETSVRVRLNEEIEAINESVAELIFEEIKSLNEEFETKLDKYLDYIAEEFMKENEVAIESGIKVELAESIFEGFKNLLVENNIDVPEDKVDVVETVVSENEELKESYNKEVEKNIELLEQINEFKKKEVISEMVVDLTEVEVEKLTSLFENIDFSDAESFKKKATIIKEAYVAPISTGKNILHEDYEGEREETKVLSADVSAALRTLERFNNK